MNALAMYMAAGEITPQDVAALATKPMVEAFEEVMTADELRQAADGCEGMSNYYLAHKLRKLADAFDRGRGDVSEN